MKHDTETLRETLRETLLDIHRGNRVELANIPLSAAWPTISRMFEALSFSDSDRRSDAVERAVDDLTRLIGDATTHPPLRGPDRGRGARRGRGRGSPRAQAAGAGGLIMPGEGIA